MEQVSQAGRHAFASVLALIFHRYYPECEEREFCQRAMVELLHFLHLQRVSEN